jgi:hypothetical protein
VKSYRSILFPSLECSFTAILLVFCGRGSHNAVAHTILRVVDCVKNSLLSLVALLHCVQKDLPGLLLVLISGTLLLTVAPDMGHYAVRCDYYY